MRNDARPIGEEFRDIAEHDQETAVGERDSPATSAEAAAGKARHGREDIDRPDTDPRDA
jgi:hypothetical protein